MEYVHTTTLSHLSGDISVSVNVNVNINKRWLFCFGERIVRHVTENIHNIVPGHMICDIQI